MLENEAIQLDWNFRMSLIHDIVKVSERSLTISTENKRFVLVIGNGISPQQRRICAWKIAIVQLPHRRQICVKNIRLWTANIDDTVRVYKRSKFLQ